MFLKQKYYYISDIAPNPGDVLLCLETLNEAKKYAKKGENIWEITGNFIEFVEYDEMYVKAEFIEAIRL